jgi:hypothetical protein
MNMNKFILITAVTLVTMLLAHQGSAQGTLPGNSLPLDGKTGAWPPMPSPNLNYRPLLQLSQYPFPSAPEVVLPGHGISGTTTPYIPMPEPATAALFAVGGLAAFWWRRRV